MNNILLQLDNISLNFTKPDGVKQKVLDKISFNVMSGEIVAILGKSGCGKSTLLRIISDIIKQSSGKIKFNQDNDETSFGISMIFQTFALFPWMTVLENVELGLKAMKIPSDPVKQRALALQAIDLIGLDGFESAYPRELSGGMKQRVGFARALVVNPEVLLMDEPFSALDILTADTLKSDFLDIWNSKKTSLKSVIIVTHSIEEAVLMADRVIILGANPGRIVEEIAVTLDRPRNTHHQSFRNIVDQIYSQMANANQQKTSDLDKGSDLLNISQKLPLISPNQLVALASLLAEPRFKSSSDLSNLVAETHINTAEILRIVEVLDMLKFATIKGGVIKLTKDGKLFANCKLDARKQIFAKHLLLHVPLAAYILKVLKERPGNKADRIRFQSQLEDHLSHEDAQITIKAIIAWGRFGEIFSYNDNKRIFNLENPGA